ncbi:MAG: peroxide stress protein YaaA, partial [Rhodobacteraceae bacterium]|nr:peroxide stress protein YaaA [Paracoccaceae bacterium]
MLIVISPAKTLDYDSPLSFKKSTSAHFHSYSDKLIEILKKKSASQISHLMKISDSLGELNYHRYHSWNSKSGSRNARQAVLAFMGDVYSGLDAKSLSE